jgi:hypothetical protein
MADSFKVTDGVTEIELIYAGGSQEDYKLQYGTRVSVPEPAVLVHQPDDGESQPIRAVDRDREVYLTMNVPGDDWDAVIDAVTRLKRLVDGAHSQALRYWTIGDVDRVVLRVQKDGSSRYTDLPVKWGFVDDSGAYHTSIQTEIGWQIVVMLVVAPYGEGAPIALRNDLASSPHFIEDSNSDGLADGWTIIGGSGALNTTYYLVGGQSQELTVTSSGAQYINSDTVTASTSSDGVGYIWICEPTGTADPVTIRLLNGSNGTISFETFDPAAPADYDKTAIGAGGEAWYRYSVTGNNGGTSGLRIQVIRGSGDASAAGTYYLDAAYLEVDQTVVPDAWCSTSSIENRYDPTSTDEARINYIDIWGVPGDSLARISQTIDAGTAYDFMIVSVAPDVFGNPNQFSGSLHREGEDCIVLSTDSGDITWFSAKSTPSDASSSAGEYGRFTVQSGATANGYIPLSAKNNFTGYRVFARARISNTALKVYMKNNDYVTFSSAGNWEVVDFGYMAPTDASFDSANLDGEIYIEPTATGYYIDIDDFVLFPAGDEQFILINHGTVLDLYLDDRKLAVTSNENIYYNFIGSLFYANFATCNRFVYMSYNETVYSLNTTYDVTFTITPRSRHLLGSI